MKVTLFGYSRLNPYLLLYKRALEGQGLTVEVERLLGLKWLLTKGRACDAVHLHWIETAYEPPTAPQPVRRLTRFRFVKALRGIVRFVDFAAALWLAKVQGKIVVHTVHNLNPHDHLAFRPFAVLHRAAQRLILSLSDRVHVHNRYTRGILEATHPRTNGLTVVPIGNYIGCYPNRVSRTEARQRLDLSSADFLFLFLGLVRPYKGLEELIDAFKAIESPAGRLWIVGRPFDQRYQKRLLGLCRDQPAIRFVPDYVPDEAIQLYMNACNVCVLPYRNFTTSSAAMLAWSFGRPIVAPAIGSFPELVTPGVGILYDPSQPEALACALRRAEQQVWSDTEILDFARTFDWDRLGPQLAGLYGSDGEKPS
jgi:glycosyltransferase involved in cell wall biosynthesis